MAQRSRKISTTVFFLAIFAFLVVFLGAWLYRTYTEGTTYSTGESESALRCSNLGFGVDPQSVLYEDGQIYLEVTQTHGDPITLMVLESGTETREVPTGGLALGLPHPISVELPWTGEVLVYPSGCKNHNSKKVNVP